MKRLTFVVLIEVEKTEFLLRYEYVIYLFFIKIMILGTVVSIIIVIIIKLVINSN